MDYAATTPLDKEVKKAMEPYFGNRFGNPNSLHFFGQEARGTIDISRQKIAESIGAGFEEIIFTGSATEANNLALRGALKHLSASWRTKVPKHLKLKIIISAIEHDSVLETAKDLTQEGVEVVILPVNKNGIVDLKKLKENLDKRTILVSIMYANNETGVIQPINKISKIISDFKKNISMQQSDNKSIYPLFHMDAVQAFQFLNCNVNDLGVDMMTLSAHKIYGPKGIGMLYIREPKTKVYNLKPILTGGGQEFGLRSGTENVAGIVGMAKAIELADKNRGKEIKRINELKKYFIKELSKIYSKIQVNGGDNCLPNIVNVYFSNFKNEDLLIKLDMAGVAISSGSACASFAAKPSHVLKAMGFNEKRIKSSLRFSFGKFTTKGEVNKALKTLKNILK